MKKSILAMAALVASASFARAELIKVDEALVVFGTGLGAVNTLVTVHDTGSGNNIEGGCIHRSGGADTTTTCAPDTEISERDNLAINQTILFSTLGFGPGTNIGAVVNISEIGTDVTVTLTGLYLSFYDANDEIIHTAEYNDTDLNLTQGTGTGLGGSGFTFALDASQLAFVQAQAANIVRVGGGVQFAPGSTNDGSETLHVVMFPQAGDPGDPGAIPEPASMMLIGGGLVGLGLFRRFRK